MARSYAGRLIRGSQVAANLSTAVDLYTPCEIQPTCEYQVRPLVTLEPAQQCEVWEQAVRSADGKVVTFKQVKALVDGLIGPAPPLPPKMKDSYAHSDAHARPSASTIPTYHLPARRRPPRRRPGPYSAPPPAATSAAPPAAPSTAPSAAPPAAPPPAPPGSWRIFGQGRQTSGWGP